jgi:hypothetical protein
MMVGAGHGGHGLSKTSQESGQELVALQQSACSWRQSHTWQPQHCKTSWNAVHQVPRWGLPRAVAMTLQMWQTFHIAHATVNIWTAWLHRWGGKACCSTFHGKV